MSLEVILSVISNKKIQTSFKQKINKEDKDNNIIDFIDYLRRKNQHCK